MCSDPLPIQPNATCIILAGTDGRISPSGAICLVMLLTLNCLGVRGYRHMTGIKLRSITVTLLVCFMLSAISADGDWVSFKFPYTHICFWSE